MRDTNPRYFPYNRKPNRNPQPQYDNPFENEVFRVANSDFANSQQNLDLLLSNCEKTDLEKNIALQKAFYRMVHPFGEGYVDPRRINYTYREIFPKIFNQPKILESGGEIDRENFFSRNGLNFIDMFFAYGKWSGDFFNFFNNSFLMNDSEKTLKKTFLKSILSNGTLTSSFKNYDGVLLIFKNIEKHLPDIDERQEFINKILLEKNKKGESFLSLSVKDNNPMMIDAIFNFVENNFKDHHKRKALVREMLLQNKLINNSVFRDSIFSMEYNSLDQIFKTVDKFFTNDEEKSEFLKEFMDKQDISWELLVKNLKNTTNKSAKIILNQFKKITDKSYLENINLHLQQTLPIDVVMSCHEILSTAFNQDRSGLSTRASMTLVADKGKLTTRQ
jgi:hypothetical protein